MLLLIVNKNKLCYDKVPFVQKKNKLEKSQGSHK